MRVLLQGKARKLERLNWLKSNFKKTDRDRGWWCNAGNNLLKIQFNSFKMTDRDRGGWRDAGNNLFHGQPRIGVTTADQHRLQ